MGVFVLFQKVTSLTDAVSVSLWWDSNELDYMDGKNEDTWFDELDINPHWKKNLKRFNLSPEVWNVICRLHYGDTIALKQSMEEQLYWIHKYNNLKKNIKNLLD